MKRNYSPVLLSNPLQSWFNDPFFGLDFPRFRSSRYGFREPFSLAADFYEDEGHFFARVEMPGVKREEVKVSLEKDVLSISCEHKSEEEHLSEGLSCARSLRVPEGIDADKISAKLEDGILTITLPKAEGAKRRQISVN